MTLRPNDYDRNGDIIPDSVKEDKDEVCKHYRKSKDKKYDFFCTHYNAPLVGDCSNCVHYEAEYENDMNNDLISRNALKKDFKERLAKCDEWIEKAKDKETKIRASAVKAFIAEVIMTIDNEPTVETYTEEDMRGDKNG